MNNGNWVRSSVKYFKTLDKIISSGNHSILGFNNIDNQALNNLKELFKQLLHIDYYVSLEHSYPKDSLHVTITFTHKCNLTCNHCVLSSSPDSSNVLSTYQIKTIIDRVLLVSPTSLIISGGEPFIRKDLFNIISYIRKYYDGNLVIMTNGLLINKKDIPFIKENVDALDISLDGYDNASVKKIRGNKVFSQVQKKINWLKNENFKRISLSMVLTKDNYLHRKKFMTLCEKLEVKPILRPFLPDGRAIEGVNDADLIPTDILFEEYSCHHCKPGDREFVISYNGDIYPCNNLISDDLKIGNILKDKDILSKLKNRQGELDFIFNKIDSLRPLNDDKCRDCKVNLFCWECISRFQAIKNNSTKLAEFCKYKKEKLYKEVWGEKI
ncbi:radical SAM/SPASM domain-containing protein [Staphylococcus felis]|nr:radical SAM protein [Staphylococcus felis]